MTRLFERLTAIPVLWHFGVLSLGCLVMFWIAARVDALYLASGHPASHAAGQLSFSALQIQAHYAAMQEDGSLHLYVASQRSDFGLIAAIALVSVLLGTFLARLGGPGSLGWRLGMGAAGLGLAGASMDVIENLLSFVMLARPQDIPQGLAFVYSSFAATKFGLLKLAMLAALASLLVGTVERLAGAYRPR